MRREREQWTIGSMIGWLVAVGILISGVAVLVVSLLMKHWGG